MSLYFRVRRNALLKAWAFAVLLNVVALVLDLTLVPHWAGCALTGLVNGGALYLYFLSQERWHQLKTNTMQAMLDEERMSPSQVWEFVTRIERFPLSRETDDE